MKAEIKARWIEALRSGKYEQGKRALHPYGSKFCCLGVLCDVVDPSKWEGEEYNGAVGYLPGDLQDEVRLLDREQTHLINMNDGNPANGIAGKPFSEIADWIERNIPAEE